jgi:hypothetical protein
MKNDKLKLVLLVSVILRVGAALYLGDHVVALPGAADQISYHNLALRVLDGHGFTFDQAWWPLTQAGQPTAHWSYLYTLYLTAVYFIFGPHPLAARIIQAVVVGLLQPYWAYRIAEQIFGPSLESAKGEETRANTFFKYIPLLAASVTAVYIYFVYYAATLMTEPFYITALLASFSIALSLATRIRGSQYRYLAIGLGLALTVTVFLRQLFLLFVPFLFLWLLIVGYRRHSLSRVLSSIAIATAVLVLSIIPISLYNYTRFNDFVLLNTNAGYAFFWANHPIYGTEFIPASEMSGTYADLVPPELRDLNEAELDRALLKRGIQFVVAEPGRYVLLSLNRIPAYFKFWPDPASGMISNVARVGSFGLLLPFIAYGLLRPFVNRSHAPGRPRFVWPTWPLILLYLFILVYTGIHLLSWALVRYRLPVDAVFVIFAALALAESGQLVETGIQRSRNSQDPDRSLLRPMNASLGEVSQELDK